MNQLEVGAGLRTAALQYQATVLLSWAVIIQASTKPWPPLAGCHHPLLTTMSLLGGLLGVSKWSGPF